jgi:hypothetical protein
MPRGDRTGPNGLGAMSGRAAGFCAGFNRPGFMNAGGRFYGRGGRGMGRRFNYGHAYMPDYYQPPMKYDAKTELEFLENEIQALNDQLSALSNRMKELKKEE